MRLFLLANESQKEVLQHLFAQIINNCPKSIISVNAKIQVTETEGSTHLVRLLGLYWLASCGLEEDRARTHKAPHRKRARQDGRSIPPSRYRQKTMAQQTPLRRYVRVQHPAHHTGYKYTPFPLLGDDSRYPLPPVLL